MTPCLRIAGHWALLALAALTFAADAQAQGDWPTRIVRIVSPLAPGGLSDTLARVLGQQLEARWGVRFYVENRAGGGGVIGSAHVAEQPPDGYTLLVSGIGSHVIAPVINANVGFDPLKSFTHIAYLGGAPTVLVVNPATGIATLKEYIVYAQGKGELPFGSAGGGTHGHLIGELFAREAGLRLAHVPYRGAGAVMGDIVAGHVPSGFVTLSTAGQHIRAGLARPLAVTSEERVPQFPDIPTFRELGYRELVALTWFALAAPPDLPQSLVRILNREAVAIMTSPEARKRLEVESVQVQNMTPEALTAFIAAETVRWGPIAKSVSGRR